MCELLHNYEKTVSAAKYNADRLKRNGFEIISIQRSKVVHTLEKILQRFSF